MNQQPSPHILPDRQSRDSGSRLERLNRLKQQSQLLSQSDVNQIDILSEPINIQLHSQVSDNSQFNQKEQEKKLSSAKSTLDVF